MTTNTESAQVQIGLASQSSLSWRHLVPVLALFDALLIASTAIAIGSFYYLIKFETTIGFVSHLNFGLAVGLVFVLVRVLRGDYAFPIYATNFDFNRLGLAWLLTFLTLLSLFFLFKIGDEFSRGTAIGLFVTGPLVLAIQQLLFTRAASLAARSGRLALRRVYLIGGRDDVAEFRWSMEEQLSGLSIVGITAIDEAAGGEALDERLQAAVESARDREPDDVLILLPLSDQHRIDVIVDRFKVLPSSIHLGVAPLVRRYPALRASREGEMASLELVREPLTNIERYVKRAIDIAGATMGLVFLSPVLIGAALAIKLTSRGPVFYRQDRHCYNQSTFRIYKFRSMYDGQDSAVFRQATKDDPRITPVGAYMRKTNIDELPQLINVLLGDMSLVGPRPHPLALDRRFESRISLYARRHNVKPGITGWAQVNGLRGETDTEDKMRARVEHDLHYLDHWSLLLDLRILVMTVFSSKAFSNAC